MRIHAPHAFAPKLIPEKYFYVLASGVCEYSHCIHIEGGGKGANTYLQRCEYIFAKVRIHISKIISRKYFPVFARVRIQAPHVFVQKLIPQEFSCMSCNPERLGDGSKIGKSPKVVGRGCKRSFGPTAQRSPKSLVHQVQPCFAPVTSANPGCTGAEAFRSLGSKDLLHSLLTTFGDFPIFDPSPKRSGLQCMY